MFLEFGPCPACGDPIDYCQGHGRIGDPLGYHIVRDHHDFHKHDRCHPASDCREDCCYCEEAQMNTERTGLAYRCPAHTRHGGLT